MMRVFGLIALLISCGTEDKIPTTLEADPSTGQVSIKGDKGDKGDKGETGPAGPAGEKGEKGADGSAGAAGAKGDKGDAGADGKAAEEQLAGVWKDPITGRRWTTIHYKVNFAGVSACGWTLPSAAILLPALQHGLAKNLTVTTPAGTERAWISDVDPTAPGPGYQRTMTVMDPTIDIFGSVGGYLTTNLYRVYCYKD